MKIMKRAFLITLATLMLVTCMPFAAFSAEATGPECEINGEAYDTLELALREANRSRTDVTIKLLRDVIFDIEQTINATRGNIKITIDGKGHTVTTNGDHHTFIVKENLVIKNTKFVHNAAGSLLEITGSADVTLENVVVDASAVLKRRYAIINTMGAEINLTMSFTDIVCRVDSEDFSNQTHAIIRAGNGNNAVNITASDSNFDIACDSSSHGIYVTSTTTTGSITLENTNIKAGYGKAIYAPTGSPVTLTAKGGVFETATEKFDNANDVGSASNVFFGIANPSLSRSTAKIYIYGHQDTVSAGGATFDARFIAAVSDELSAIEEFSTKMTISVANATTSAPAETYTITTLSGALNANGVMNAITKSGYKFASYTKNSNSKTGTVIFNVTLSYTLYGVEHTVGTATASYKDGVCNEFNYSVNVKELTGRYLMVSDLHYVGTTGRSNGANSSRYNYRGLDTEARMNKLIEAITYEYKLRGLDAVYVLGDLSTDDWFEGHESSWLDKYYARLIYDKLVNALSPMGIKVYILPGNHDSYPQAKWEQVFSGTEMTKRQYSVVDGENVFIMLDTYRGAENDSDYPKLDGEVDKGNGSEWTGVDISYLRAELEKYKDKENVFICSHSLGDAPAALTELISQYDNVVAFFEGHVHHYDKSRNFANVPLINTGNFAYGDYTNIWAGDVKCSCNSDECLWGFQIVETTADNTVVYNVKVAHNYTFEGGSKSQNQPYTKGTDIVLK